MKKNLEEKTLGDYLNNENLSKEFINYHLIPMVSAIWSMPPSAASQMPLSFFLKFFQNHGLFKLKNRPQWYTVSNRSRTYVKNILSKISGEHFKNYPIKKIKLKFSKWHEEVPLKTKLFLGPLRQASGQKANTVHSFQWFILPSGFCYVIDMFGKKTCFCYPCLSIESRDKRTDVWSRPSCIYTQIVSPKKNWFFSHKKYFPKIFWHVFTFILYNFSERTLKYFKKKLNQSFLYKNFKERTSKVAHNRPRPQPTAQNWFLKLWNLGTRHLFSYLC